MDNNVIDFGEALKTIRENTGLEIKHHNYSGCQHRRRVVDPELRVVDCRDCGVRLDPIEVLLQISKQWGEWKVVQLQKRVNQLEAMERALKDKMKFEMMTPEEKEMSPAEFIVHHRKTGCPRERMWFKGKMIHCYCGSGWNRESFPALAREVEEAHDRLRRKELIALVK